MKRSKCTDEQILAIVKEGEARRAAQRSRFGYRHRCGFHHELPTGAVPFVSLLSMVA